MNKRGISPILATVLLIGFAVALGAMVMNWTKDLSSDPCKDVDISIYQSGKLLEPGVCYTTDNKILLNVENKGIPVSGLRMTTEMGIADSAVLSGSIFKQEVIFSTIERAKDKAWITIVPEIEYKDNITTCNEQGTRIDKLLTPCP